MATEGKLEGRTRTTQRTAKQSGKAAKGGSNCFLINPSCNKTIAVGLPFMYTRGMVLLQAFRASTLRRCSCRNFVSEAKTPLYSASTSWRKAKTCTLLSGTRRTSSSTDFFRRSRSLDTVNTINVVNNNTRVTTTTITTMGTTGSRTKTILNRLRWPSRKKEPSERGLFPE